MTRLAPPKGKAGKWDRLVLKRRGFPAYGGLAEQWGRRPGRGDKAKGTTTVPLVIALCRSFTYGALTSFDRELIVDVRGLCSARFHTPGLFGVDCLTIITAARFSNDSHCRFGRVDVVSKPRSRRVRGPALSMVAPRTAAIGSWRS